MPVPWMVPYYSAVILQFMASEETISGGPCKTLQPWIVSEQHVRGRWCSAVITLRQQTFSCNGSQCYVHMKVSCRKRVEGTCVRTGTLGHYNTSSPLQSLLKSTTHATPYSTRHQQSLHAKLAKNHLKLSAESLSIPLTHKHPSFGCCGRLWGRTRTKSKGRLAQDATPQGRKSRGSKQ
jgi:hypothetical protein